MSCELIQQEAEKDPKSLHLEFMNTLLARISHRISEQIAPLLPQIASQQGEDSVHETRTHRTGEQDEVARCASCQRSGEKCGLALKK